MARPKVFECGCLSGKGATVSEAKADLAAKVEAALKGVYHPAIVNHGRYSAVVYRHPEGWSYKMLEAEEMARPGIVPVEWGTEYPTKDAAIQAAAFHVIDLGPSENYHTDADVPAFLTDKEKRGTVLSNARFRRAYLWARENKPEMSEGEIHQWACNNHYDERFA